MEKNAYYFSHDANARHDEKILMLMAEHGMQGYGVYWVLVEMMFEAKDTELSHKRMKGVALSCNIAITVLEDIIKSAINESLFESDGEFFWSNSLRRRKEKFEAAREKRVSAGKKGMAVRWNGKGKNNKAITKDNKAITKDNKAITKDNKGKEIKGKKIKENEYSAEFDLFWEKYPKKKGKQDAFKMFKKVVDNMGQLIEALEKYLPSVSEAKYYMKPMNFLKEWRDWLEDDETACEAMTPEEKWFASGPSNETLSRWEEQHQKGEPIR